MKCSGVFAELRIRRSSLVCRECLRIRRIGGVSPPYLRKFFPHLIFQIRGRPAFDLPHFGSCGKRIWVMWQTHLGHVANAFGVQEGIRGSPDIVSGLAKCYDIRRSTLQPPKR